MLRQKGGETPLTHSIDFNCIIDIRVRGKYVSWAFEMNNKEEYIQKMIGWVSDIACGSYVSIKDLWRQFWDVGIDNNNEYEVQMLARAFILFILCHSILKNIDNTLAPPFINMQDTDKIAGNALRVLLLGVDCFEFYLPTQEFQPYEAATYLYEDIVKQNMGLRYKITVKAVKVFKLFTILKHLITVVIIMWDAMWNEKKSEVLQGAGSSNPSLKD
ncbi:hypothetical protein ACH5RR_015693 [Cinchona calisaya]|uniref:Uncharacterized protein n=1 Tax=Cinchona calisaya TaxID=153742 RepID=A0ABD2ZUR9_9GENT